MPPSKQESNRTCQPLDQAEMLEKVRGDYQSIGRFYTARHDVTSASSSGWCGSHSARVLTGRRFLERFFPAIVRRLRLSLAEHHTNRVRPAILQQRDRARIHRDSVEPRFTHAAAASLRI